MNSNRIFSIVALLFFTGLAFGSVDDSSTSSSSSSSSNSYRSSSSRQSLTNAFKLVAILEVIVRAMVAVMRHVGGVRNPASKLVAAYTGAT